MRLDSHSESFEGGALRLPASYPADAAFGVHYNCVEEA